MLNQHKILRVLRLIIALQTPPSKSRIHIANILEVQERTVFRYINILEEIGFRVLKDSSKRYYIENADFSDLVTFSIEEAAFLKSMLLTNKKNTPLVDSMLKKIYLTSEIQVSAKAMQNAKLSTIIEEIAHAISSEKQLCLKKYLSINSETISNRIVEPIVLTEDYKYLIAYEVQSKQNKTYSIERINGAETLPTKFKYKEAHEKLTLDAFGFAPKKNKETYYFEIELSLKAKTLLTEEYPKTTDHIEKINNKKYRLTIAVNNTLPLARFLVGLKNDIKITTAPKEVEVMFFEDV